MKPPPASFPPGYEWDEAKNQSNIAKHGIDFWDAVQVFDKPTLDRVDLRRDYGEVRISSIGDVAGLLIATVTHTERGQRTRLISARSATRAERAAYEDFARRLADEQRP